MTKTTGLALAGAMLLASTAQAGPTDGIATATAPVSAADAAKRFGAREQIAQISLSPDGTRYAALVPDGTRGVRVSVGGVDGSPAKEVLVSSGDPYQLTYCDWASDLRLICGMYGTSGTGKDMLDYTRLLTLNADGSDMKLLSARTSSAALGVMQSGGNVIDWLADGRDGGLLMTRQFVPEQSIGTLLANAKQGLGVERVDPVSLRRTLVEQPQADAREFITDGHGTVRVTGIRPKDGEGYDKTSIHYLYRKPDSRAWSPLSIVTGDSQSETGFDPYAVDRDLNVAYGFDIKDGRIALFKTALDGTLKKDLVYARPDVDVDGLVRLGRQHRVVGVSFATDRRQTDFFDPELKKLSRSLSKAIPGLPLVTFVGASGDESKLLLFAGSDVDSGQYMLFDKKTRQLHPMFAARPELDDMKLAPVSQITFPAADGTQIPAYLTLPLGGTGKGLPAIVMPHGGPGDRDEWGFDWLVQFLAARGYAVIQPNFRGSSGYGQAWFQHNGFQSWKIAIGDVNDAGRWMTRQGIAAPGKLAIFGWSYGGYAALQSSVLDPDLFKAIVAVAPVTDLESLRQERETFSDYELVNAFIGKGPHVREGSPAQNAGRIKAPVLIFHADRDRNVDIAESRLMASRLKKAGGKVELVEFKGLDHQIDDSDARTAMLTKADVFLRANLGL